MTVPFQVDTGSLYDAVLGSDADRNDLAVFVENGSAYNLTVAWQVDHGHSASSNGSNPVPGMPAPASGARSIVPNTFALGVVAEGDGAAIFVYITSGDYAWGIYARTPPNAQNWFQYTFSNTGRSQGDTYTQIQNMPETNFGGTWNPNNTAPQTQLTISYSEMGGVAGAAYLEIQFVPN